MNYPLKDSNGNSLGTLGTYVEVTFEFKADKSANLTEDAFTAKIYTGRCYQNDGGWSDDADVYTPVNRFETEDRTGGEFTGDESSAAIKLKCAFSYACLELAHLTVANPKYRIHALPRSASPGM